MDKKILIIDDEPLYLKMAALILEESKYKTVLACDGREGVEKAQKEQPDLILLDIRLPILDGIQTLKALKSNEETKKIPVIMCTVYDALKDIRESFSAGAMGYIIKPYDPEKLINEIKKLLSK